MTADMRDRASEAKGLQGGKLPLTVKFLQC